MVLDASFWRRFAKTTWEKKSVSVRNIKSPLLEMDASQVFSSLVEYSDQARKRKDPAGLKFYVNGHRQLDKAVLKLLPKKSDRSLLGYHERMKPLFPDYCLVCDELLQVNLAKQNRLNEFTASLYREVGFPNRFSEMGLYLGNYRKTPFGVHVDGCGVFSFPIVGEKTFRIWKPSFAKKHPSLERSFQYSKFKSASKVLKAKTGDMTYWPSSAWHIAESNGRFSATWSLGVWVDQTHQSDVNTIVAGVLARNSGANANAGTTRFERLNSSAGEVRALPDAYLETLQSLRNLSPAKMKTEFLKAWMVHTSKQGFKTSPGRAPRARLFKRTLKLRDPQTPVRWMFSKDEGEYYYSFNGSLSDGLASKTFLKLITSLNAGESIANAAKLRARMSLKELVALTTLNNAGAFALD